MLLSLLRRCRGSPKKKNELVATTSKGDAWGEYGLLQAFQRAQQKVGLSGWTFHGMRHYFCSELFRRGGSAPAVQALAGHSHLATTERYAHVIDSDLEQTIGLFGDRGNSVETGPTTFP
jgi:site-specific recombinase XerD